MQGETKTLQSITVGLSAPAISLMLYDNCKSNDQTGFLLGNIFRTEHIAAEGANTLRKINFHIQIKAVVPCPELNLYKMNYKWKNIPSFNNIVGWFTYRELITTNPIDMLKLTFTEKLIHKYLKGLGQFKKLPFFTGCVLDTYNNPSRSVYKFDLKFFQLNGDGRFQLVECKNPITELKHFERVLYNNDENRKNFVRTCDEDFETLCNSEPINDLIQKLAIAESEMFNLENDINKISKDIKQLHQSNMKKKNVDLQIQADAQSTKKNTSWLHTLQQKRFYEVK